MYLSTVALSKYEIPTGCPRVTAGTIFVDILFELTKTVFVNSTSNITTNIETAALSSQPDRMGGQP